MHYFLQKWSKRYSGLSHFRWHITVLNVFNPNLKFNSRAKDYILKYKYNFHFKHKYFLYNYTFIFSSLEMAVLPFRNDDNADYIHLSNFQIDTWSWLRCASKNEVSDYVFCLQSEDLLFAINTHAMVSITEHTRTPARDKCQIYSDESSLISNCKNFCTYSLEYDELSNW